MKKCKRTDAGQPPTLAFEIFISYRRKIRLLAVINFFLVVVLVAIIIFR